MTYLSPQQATRHPNARKLDMKNFVHRPIPRLLRYDLLLKSILKETPPTHEDMEAIPQAIEVIQALGKETDTGIAAAKEKVEIWGYNSNLVFKVGEAIVSHFFLSGSTIVIAICRTWIC